MTKTSGANLFKEPTKWPLMPPWWLLSSPQAAALLSVTSATLHNWRVRGEGPEPVPPMYLRKTQGNPIYYRYSNVRTWAATRVGLEYSFEDQCHDFFERVFPPMNGFTGPLKGVLKIFDDLFAKERSKVKSGNDPWQLSLADVETMDVYYSRQPT
ncbi:MAG: helix-turn-helix transcriptional regulator [Sulfitobacter sp.]